MIVSKSLMRCGVFLRFLFREKRWCFFRSRNAQFFSSWVCWDQLRPPGGLSLCWFDGRLQWDLDGYSSRNGDSRHVGIWPPKKKHSLAGKNMQIWRTLLGGCVFLKATWALRPQESCAFSWFPRVTSFNWHLCLSAVELAAKCCMGFPSGCAIAICISHTA